MIKIGFIGTGSFATQHAEILKSLNVTIAACYGTNPRKTLDFSQRFQCRIYTDPDALISKNIIDVLYIVVPPFAHNGQFELKAIEENIPFLCEKPIGLDLSTCDHIAAQLAKTKLITSSGYQLRYEPLFDQIKKILENQNISTVRLDYYAHTPEVYWWRNADLSGGMMVESGSHYVDLLRYIFGEINSVCAIKSDGIANRLISGCSTYDSMEAILNFKTGLIGSIGITHLLNAVQPRNHSLNIYGNNFWLKVDLYKLRYKNEATLTYKSDDTVDWKQISKKTDKKDLIREESLAFLSAIQNNNPSLIRSSYIDACHTLKVTLAMNTSCQIRKFISIK